MGEKRCRFKGITIEKLQCKGISIYLLLRQELFDRLRRVYRLRYVVRAMLLRRHTIEELPVLYTPKYEVVPKRLQLGPLVCEATNELISQSRSYVFARPTLGIVYNCKIVPESGYIVTAKGKIVCPPHFNTRFLADVLSPRLIWDAANRPSSERFEWAFYLLGPWHRNYYHWLIDYCPILQIYESYRNEVPSLSSPKLLYPKGLPAPYQQVLDLLWKEDERFEWCGEIIDVKNLIVPSSHKGISNPRVIEGAPPSMTSIQWIQGKVFPYLQESAATRILISRSKARYRHVANEDELLGSIAALGFKLISLEEYSFLEQAAIFRDAEAVVAVHGAGLANLIFCQQGTLVVEIFPDSVERHDYWSISEIMGLDYVAVKAMPIARNMHIKAIRVDCLAITSILERKLNA